MSLFAQTIRALPDAVEKGAILSVRDAALVVKDIFLTGPPSVGLPRSSPLPKASGARWGARFKEGKSQGRYPYALVSYVGPVHWFEQGTKKHNIVSRKVGGSKASRAAMNVGPGMFSQSVVTFTRTSGRGKLGPGIRRTAIKGRGVVRTPMGMRAYVRHPGQRPRPFFARVKAQSSVAATRVVASGVRRNIVASGFGR